ncbi:MAG: hypothetical protein AMDU3_IPLC00004G0409 [Thermoplasmatales archaeon I-plasma]|jgi:hypothetical protein|nr:MAG: hypothetical protein AMDU3_IPLC00004G0409 [Thermoplasmatales archaeon I-plasma]MCL5930443.1 hypothetical protein [Candidatus Thermoplasmatota archaeon]
MVSKKTVRYQNKSRNLNEVSQQIEQQLQAQGFKTQSRQLPTGFLIQAQKAGILRDIITADRAFTIMLEGQPDDFKVTVGIGKFIQNLAVAAVEVILLSELFLLVDVPEMLWTLHVENGIMKEIDKIVG